MSASLYQLKNIKQQYEGGPLNLDITELSIKASGITGLVGPNGSGKSTLLKVLSFLLPCSGEILFDGEPAAGREDTLRREVTYLLQDPYLLKRSVYENVAYGLRLRGEKELTEKVNEALLQVGLEPEKFAARPWYQLSGGEAQRVALASRLALRPKALLLDEPTANVDEASAQLVMDAAFKASKDYGTTVIVATHDFSWLYETASAVISLYEGKVAGSGTENLLSGGWQRSGEYMLRPVSDGQAIFAYPPRKPGQTVMLSAAGIELSKELPAARAEENVLSGRLVQLTLDGSGRAILAAVAAGEQLIRVKLPVEEAAEKEISPGATVYLSFPYSALRWL